MVELFMIWNQLNSKQSKVDFFLKRRQIHFLFDFDFWSERFTTVVISLPISGFFFWNQLIPRQMFWLHSALQISR